MKSESRIQTAWEAGALILLCALLAGPAQAAKDAVLPVAPNSAQSAGRGQPQAPAAVPAAPALHGPDGAPLPHPEAPMSSSEFSTVSLGGLTLEVESFLVQEDLDALQRFYRDAVRSAGWRVQPLPWQARQWEYTQDLRTVAARTRDARTRERLEEELRLAERVSASLQAQLYGRHGSRHLIVNLLPASDGTLVFLNRWEGERGFWEESDEGAVTNAFCSTLTAVPPTPRWGTDVPAYPDGRVLAQSVSAADGGVTLIFMTADVRQAVRSFYVHHLTAGGWWLAQERVLPQLRGAPVARMLRFERPGALC